jgi:hypothetical protein
VQDLTPSQKGAVAEAAVTHATMELGLTVLRPLSEGRRYDLVIDLEPELLRVQCKLARRINGVLVTRVSTCRYTPHGYVRRGYDETEIDAFAAYSWADHRCYLIPISEAEGRTTLHLRLDPTLNSQAEGIKWALDYDFATIIARLKTQSSDTKLTSLG